MYICIAWCAHFCVHAAVYRVFSHCHLQMIYATNKYLLIWTDVVSVLYPVSMLYTTDLLVLITIMHCRLYHIVFICVDSGLCRFYEFQARLKHWFHSLIRASHPFCVPTKYHNLGLGHTETIGKKSNGKNFHTIQTQIVSKLSQTTNQHSPPSSLLSPPASIFLFCFPFAHRHTLSLAPKKIQHKLK